MKRIVFSSLFLLTIVLAVIVQGEDCSRFRGQACDGMFSETGLLKKWPEGGPKLSWLVKNLGTVYLVKPNPAAFEPVSQFAVSEGTDEHWAHPTIANGRLYIRHGDALMAYDIKAL